MASTQDFRNGLVLNWKNDIWRRSTRTVSAFSPARNVVSTILPLRTFFILPRTNAPPLPGLTC